jgi:hypothetical protein
VKKQILKLGTPMNWAALPPLVKQRAIRALDENRATLIAQLTLANVPPRDAEMVVEVGCRRERCQSVGRSAEQCLLDAGTSLRPLLCVNHDAA